jgi:2-haloacid dehalogenase
MALNSPPVALFFDVFGTCVDWRSTVTKALVEAARATLGSASSISSDTRSVASGMTEKDWGQFAQQWRNTYKKFTGALARGEGQWKTVDQHHFDSLVVLLKEWHLEGLWPENELGPLSLIWHRLDPWLDSAAGVDRLNTHFQTATLSNGNVSLLKDLKEHSGIHFTHLISGELFGTYKPNPKVYLGAAARLGLDPAQCGMVAAHLIDLKAAKSCGFQTMYVERPEEEDWSFEEVQRAKDAAFVDIWITGQEDGFLALASRLGIEESKL